MHDISARARDCQIRHDPPTEQHTGDREPRVKMQADITDRFVLLVRLDQRITALARLRAAALYALVLGVLLLLFAGTARPAQPLLPFAAGALLGGVALPLLLVSQGLLQLKLDARRGLVRHLYRRGHRVEYPEFDHVGETPAVLRVQRYARSTH